MRAGDAAAPSAHGAKCSQWAPKSAQNAAYRARTNSRVSRELVYSRRMLANRTRASLGRVCSAVVLCAALAAVPKSSAAQASAVPAAAPKPAAHAASPAGNPSAPPAPGGSAIGPASADKREDTPAPSSAEPAAAPSQSEQPAESDTAEAGSALDAQAENAGDTAEAPAPAASLTDARRVVELRTQLQRESAQHVNNLWPWLTLGAGVGAVLVGTIGGAGYVLACDGECGTTPWVSVLVVAGAGVATLGTIWLLRINHDNAQVESRTHRLERELDRLDHATGPRNRSQARAAPILSLHF
jgi:hypothetical protein